MTGDHQRDMHRASYRSSHRAAAERLYGVLSRAAGKTLRKEGLE